MVNSTVSGLLATIIFWGSLIGSTSLALWGIVHPHPRLLLLSSGLILPATLYLAMNPGGRFFLISPLLLLLAWCLLHTQRAEARIGALGLVLVSPLLVGYLLISAL